MAGVLVFHAAPSMASGGFLGVEVFFVLSGYLLTAHLLGEHARTGTVDWRSYLRRRARRVGPALAVFLMALVVLGPLVAGSDAHRLRGDVLLSALGLTNWHLIHDGNSYFTGLGRPPLVQHLWSLAVEIQFYAVVPALVCWLARRSRRSAAAALLGGIAASALLMGWLAGGADSSRAYYGTDTRIGALLTGALLALALTPPARPRVGTAAHGAPLLGAAGLGLLVVLFLTVDEGSGSLYPGAFLACRLATAMVIVAAVRGAWAPDVLATGAARWLGLRSYSIYLWHWPLVVVTRPGLDVGWPPLVADAVVLAGGVVLGHLSYLVAERPFLGSPSRPLPGLTGHVVAATRWGVAGVAAGATAVLFVNLPTVDPIAQSLRLGEQVVAAQAAPLPAPEPTVPATTAPRPPPVPETTAASVAPPPPPTTPPTAAPQPTVPPALPGP
ncbi:MAG: acyltransferase, partial [Actinomycetota bacterium]|nr:acyltransferase [Actinomycetota bacterium]